MNGIHRFPSCLVLPAICALAILGATSTRVARAQEASQATLQTGILGQAAGHLRHGLQLAERRAVFGAHDQFVEALKIIAYQLDAESGLPTHSQALGEGLDALEEADSFLASPAAALIPADLSGIMVAHRTRIADDASAPNSALTPLQAVERYLDFAGKKLVAASGHMPAASYALYGLGRVYALRSAQDSAQTIVFERKAIALYRTALRVDLNNYLAGNELGVILYSNGSHEEALWTLLRSASVSPEAETAQNLKTVYTALGDAEGAAWADVLYQSLVAGKPDDLTVTADSGSGTALSVLPWAEIDTFSSTAIPSDLAQPPEHQTDELFRPETKALAGSTGTARGN